MWLSEKEGAKSWIGVMSELQNRGVKDILIACIDGLKGLPEAIQTSAPANSNAAMYCSHGTQLSKACAVERLQTCYG